MPALSETQYISPLLSLNHQDILTSFGVQPREQERVVGIQTSHRAATFLTAVSWALGLDPKPLAFVRTPFGVYITSDPSGSQPRTHHLQRITYPPI